MLDKLSDRFFFSHFISIFISTICQIKNFFPSVFKISCKTMIDTLRQAYSFFFAPLYSELIKRSKKEGISLSECVYHSLTGDLKDRWEIVLNLTDSRYEDANEMAKEKSVREFIEHVLPLKETQEFKEDLVP